MATVKFRVQGINDPMVLENVDHAMLSVWGVRETAVKQDTNDEAAASFKDCKQAVIDRGYGVIAAEQPFGQ